MAAEIRIIADVAAYRIRRLEMANLFAATAIMLALRLGPLELGVRLAFGVLLNLLVYLNNDFLDLDDDLRHEGRDRAKTSFLGAHRSAAVRAQLGLLCLCLALGLAWGGTLPWALIVGGGVCWAYSARLKRVPGLDIPAMIVWGVAMPAVALPDVGSAHGWLLLGQLGLFSGVFETIQVMRDHDEDRRLGVRTTAVVLGLPRTIALLRVLLVLAAGYAAAFFHVGLAVVPLALAAAPIPAPAEIGKYWNRVRLGLGLVFVVQCGIVWRIAIG
jgi:4-hydroxybenzoate polyprenyltransferase